MLFEVRFFNPLGKLAFTRKFKSKTERSLKRDVERFLDNDFVKMDINKYYNSDFVSKFSFVEIHQKEEEE